MKRAQIVERNRGHWDFEVEHPIAPPELEQGPMPRNFGVTTRRLRFTRSLSRNDGECINDTHEDSGAVVGTSERVLRSSQTRVSTSVISAREGSKSSLEIFNDHISEIVVNAGSQVDESGQDCLSPELPKATSGIDSGKAQQGIGEDDRGKENVDPLGGTSSGSPLPEWFTRRPLQDITNVLGLVSSPFYNRISRLFPPSLCFQRVITWLIMSASQELYIRIRVWMMCYIPVFHDSVHCLMRSI